MDPWKPAGLIFLDSGGCGGNGITRRNEGTETNGTTGAFTRRRGGVRARALGLLRRPYRLPRAATNTRLRLMLAERLVFVTARGKRARQRRPERPRPSVRLRFSAPPCEP